MNQKTTINRHHRNPLIKEFCPTVYDMWRERDLVQVTNQYHTSYHMKLRYSDKFFKLRAIAQELDDIRTCDEYAFADILDDLWLKFTAENNEYSIG